MLLAMGFVSPVAAGADAFGVDKDARGNARASTDFMGGYATSVDKVLRRWRHAPWPVARRVGHP